MIWIYFLTLCVNSVFVRVCVCLQCSSPLPGLRSREMCCKGLGKAWGITDCVLCPDSTGTHTENRSSVWGDCTGNVMKNIRGKFILRLKVFIMFFQTYLCGTDKTQPTITESFHVHTPTRAHTGIFSLGYFITEICLRHSTRSSLYNHLKLLCTHTLHGPSQWWCFVHAELTNSNGMLLCGTTVAQKHSQRK